ncbi:MAG: TrkH family potassium uptake protein [archaeon]
MRNGEWDFEESDRMTILGFEDVKVVFRDLGEITMYFSAAFLLPIIVSIIYLEGITELNYFLVPAILTFVFGILLNRLFKTNKETKKTHAFSMVVIAWFILPLLGAVPYMMHGVTPSNAYFDSVSAFTTTGSTPLRGETAAFPNSLMFWRSTQAWIGGAGIIMLALIGIFTYIKSYKLYKAEGREERLRPSIMGTAKRIWWVYILLTIIGVILLLFSGLTIFQSVNYSMSAISTNGMEMIWGELATMNNIRVEISLAIIMVLGSFSFYIHYQFLKKKWKAYLGDVQVRLTLILILLGAFMMLPQFMSIYGLEGIRHSFFHTTSALTAGGFQTLSGVGWSETVKMTLGLLMIIGGSAGSTAGGLKIIRFWIFLKSIYWKIKEYALPDRAYFSRKIEGEEATNKQLSTTYIFILLYILFVVLGAFVITYSEPQVPLGDSLFVTSSSQGNSGLMIGVVNPGMAKITKGVLIFNMIVGRIEIIPILHAIGFLLKYKKTPSLKTTRRI